MRPLTLTPSRALLTTTMMTLIPTGLGTSTEPVSLSKFVPRIENLPSSCQQAYTAPIAGCTRDDFPANRDPDVNNCSAACVSGLVAIVQRVNEACATVRVPATSIIGVALLGNLLPQLCGRIVVVTESPSVSTQTATATASSQSEDPQTTQSLSSTQSTSSQSDQTASSSSSPSSPSPPPSAPATPPSSTSPGLVLDTATPPPAPSSTQTGGAAGAIQKSNPDSGGGSPFDVALSSSSTSGSATMRSSASAVVVSAVALVLGAALLV